MFIPFARALPTETKVESGTSQSKSETSVNLSNSGNLGRDEGVQATARGIGAVIPISGIRAPVCWGCENSIEKVVCIPSPLWTP